MALTQDELEQITKRTVALYNRLRSPEVSANLVFASPSLLIISFSGGFCYGCGVLDYLDGFAQQFKMLNDKAELKVGKTRQTAPRTFEAEFAVKTK